MTYRGYHTRTVLQQLGTAGEQMSMAIYRGDVRMAFVDNDSDLIKRVIDQKIKEKRWPKEGAKARHEVRPIQDIGAGRAAPPAQGQTVAR